MSTPADQLGAILIGETDRQRTNKAIIASLCDRIRDQALGAIEHMPEDWDGHEMRQLLANLFARERTDSMTGKRLRKFNKECYDLPL